MVLERYPPFRSCCRIWPSVHFSSPVSLQVRQIQGSCWLRWKMIDTTQQPALSQNQRGKLSRMVLTDCQMGVSWLLPSGYKVEEGWSQCHVAQKRLWWTVSLPGMFFFCCEVWRRKQYSTWLFLLCLPSLQDCMSACQIANGRESRSAVAHGPLGN